MSAPATVRRALVYSGHGSAIEQVDPEPLGVSDLRVRVDACGICGTDLELLSGRAFAGQLKLPVRPGHEVAGTVVEVGGRVAAFTAGDTVVLHSIAPCGQCAACQVGQENRCRRSEMLGLSGRGGFGDEVVWPASRAVRYRNLPAVQAALLPDAVATAYHALRRAAVPQGGILVVIGIGGLGTHLLQLAKINRPDLTLGAVGRSEQSLARAQAIGAIPIPGLGQAGRDAARRMGFFDVLVDVSGSPDALPFGLSTLRRGGRIVLASVLEVPPALGMSGTSFMTRELEIVGSFGSSIDELREVTELADSGRLKLAGSVSTVIALDELPRWLPELITRGGGGGVRTIVVPRAADGPSR